MESRLSSASHRAEGSAVPATTARDGKGRWITDSAWITGVAGVLATIAIAVICQRNRWLEHGITWNGEPIVESQLDVKLACLLAVASIMCLVELARLHATRGAPAIRLHPDIRQGNWLAFLLQCGWHYACLLFFFSAALLAYRSMPEYGFMSEKDLYQPWFRMLEWLYAAFVWGGFPYLLLTRALLHDRDRDAMGYHVLVEDGLKRGISLISPYRHLRAKFGERHKKIVLGLLVRLFFVPLMTVFFVLHFRDLVPAVGYVFEELPGLLAEGAYTHEQLNRELWTLGRSLIFSIDTALAWCGYVFIFRWLDNETCSTEPTLLGWLVCLLSYPPFQLLALFLIIPSEGSILNAGNPWFVSGFLSLMLVSFVIYVAATVAFGVRFSNLTHRGIIRKGAYAIVRHPAYAAKNMGWWCGIFPAVIYLYADGTVGFGLAAGATLGLVVQSYVYYLRAITEERHLSQDPQYLAYCGQVRYRFVPMLV